jgi:hypothetical protein
MFAINEDDFLTPVILEDILRAMTGWKKLPEWLKSEQ